MQYNAYLEKILEDSKKGKTINKLANKIITNDLPYEDVNEFIEFFLVHDKKYNPLNINKLSIQLLD